MRALERSNLPYSPFSCRRQRIKQIEREIAAGCALASDKKIMIDEKSLNFISYGLYIISSKNKEGKINGMIANSLIQVTAEPARLAVVINKKSLTHEYIKETKIFAAMPLVQDVQLPFIGNFGFRTGRTFDKFAKIPYTLSEGGLAIVKENTVAFYEVEVEQEVDIDTHTMFIGRVKTAERLCDKVCLTYEYYHNVIKGKTPEGATHK